MLINQNISASHNDNRLFNCIWVEVGYVSTQNWYKHKIWMEMILTASKVYCQMHTTTLNSPHIEIHEIKWRRHTERNDCETEIRKQHNISEADQRNNGIYYDCDFFRSIFNFNLMKIIQSDSLKSVCLFVYGKRLW